ncbi:MAG: NAD(P)-binding domain-containing protein [Micrococcus sp.]|nr:NAD(P)-binding domain-containing protein [Micrococcus sp.]
MVSTVVPGYARPMRGRDQGHRTPGSAAGAAARAAADSARAAVDVAIVGGGQSGLAAGYFLARWARDVRTGRRAGPAPRFMILDEQPAPGGAWRHGWDSLRLFSPAAHSSLPGRRMPAVPMPQTPDAAHVREYLADYAQRYELPVRHGVRVRGIRAGDATTAAQRCPDDAAAGFQLELSSTDAAASVQPDTPAPASLHAGAVIMATGTWGRPFRPHLRGLSAFRGQQLHTRDYGGPHDFAGQRVLVIGGGNSGAQIAADLLPEATVWWACRRPPLLMPDDVDGRVLFQVASAQVRGEDLSGVGDLGDIVAVPSLRRARDEHGLQAVPLPTDFTAEAARWAEEAGVGNGWSASSRAAARVRGTQQPLDAIIWCTGFRPDLRILRGVDLQTDDAGRPRTHAQLPTRSVDHPDLYLLGYGDWCGPASATLVGVGVFARLTVQAIDAGRTRRSQASSE